MIPTIDWSLCSSTATDTTSAVPTLQCIPVILHVVVYWLLIFSGVVAVFLIIFSGFKFMNSGGNPKTVDSAKKSLTFTIVGLLVVLMSFFIINIIGIITGAQCIKVINGFGFDTCPANNSGNSTGTPTNAGSGDSACQSAGGSCPSSGICSSTTVIPNIKCDNGGSCCGQAGQDNSCSGLNHNGNCAPGTGSCNLDQSSGIWRCMTDTECTDTTKQTGTCQSGTCTYNPLTKHWGCL